MVVVAMVWFGGGCTCGHGMVVATVAWWLLWLWCHGCGCCGLGMVAVAWLWWLWPWHGVVAVDVVVAAKALHGGHCHGIVVVAAAWWLWLGHGGCSCGMVW